MKQTNNLFVLSALLAASIAAGGCAGTATDPVPTPETVAVRTETPVVIDGKLDDPVWQQAPRYRLTRLIESRWPAKTREKILSTPEETTFFQLAFDDRYVYFAVDAADSDAVDFSTGSQTKLFTNSDVVELFLKPVANRKYMENHMTPGGRQSTYILPARGRGMLDEVFVQPAIPGVSSAARVAGTLNDDRDVDRGWTAEMAIPRTELDKLGVPFDGQAPWTVMVSRYNYSVHLPTLTLSSYPEMPIPYFHLEEYFSPLRLSGTLPALRQPE
jgi:hypothetical protein